MKKVYWVPIVFFSIVAIFAGTGSFVDAETEETGEMGISFEGLEDPNFGVLDPEKPQTLVEPLGDYGQTTGSLRIDFVPFLNFSKNKIVSDTANYQADSVLFKENQEARGDFIQISDYREKQTGWSLQVRQETQFTNQNKSKSQLNGAMLSFDKSWVCVHHAASTKHPTVSKEVINLKNIGETYTLAQAEKGSGGGTWSIVFGASNNNNVGVDPTIYPRLNESETAIADNPMENHSLYLNDAVKLIVPGKTKKEPGTYTTVLTWIISELP